MARNAGDKYSFAANLDRRLLQRLAGNSRIGLTWRAASGRRIVDYLALTPGYRLECGGRDAFIDELFVASGYGGAGLDPEAIELAVRHRGSQDMRASYLEVAKR